MFIFVFFVFASALSALHLYDKPKFMVIGNPVIYSNNLTPITPQTYGTGEVCM